MCIPLLGRVGGLGFKFVFIEDNGKEGVNGNSVSWVCSFLTCMGGSLKLSVRVLRVEV